ncbi:hypothetical protein BU23DRAFT_564704 [Bimuria novae-zelandiae CBS 107.79]|uniref:Uncharacterized protein n=1 Tax=Bimuria novae-zelandiae CBS 107.79 TaxID=1447943 RepID=A0A6A5VMN7_9PLEO|nr:hypothetical protein BU23DRAFT_564704 [Bimuria novae-zelandiae CBS 107.79]
MASASGGSGDVNLTRRPAPDSTQCPRLEPSGTRGEPCSTGFDVQLTVIAPSIVPARKNVVEAHETVIEEDKYTTPRRSRSRGCPAFRYGHNSLSNQRHNEEFTDSSAATRRGSTLCTLNSALEGTTLQTRPASCDPSGQLRALLNFLKQQACGRTTRLNIGMAAADRSTGISLFRVMIRKVSSFAFWHSARDPAGAGSSRKGNDLPHNQSSGVANWGLALDFRIYERHIRCPQLRGKLYSSHCMWY